MSQGVFEQVLTILDGMDDEDVVALWNEYLEAHRYDDRRIYLSIEDVAEIVKDEDDPLELVRRVYFGNVKNWGDAFFIINGYGNIVSACSIKDDDLGYEPAALAEWISDNLNDYPDIYYQIDLDEDDE